MSKKIINKFKIEFVPKIYQRKELKDRLLKLTLSNGQMEGALYQPDTYAVLLRGPKGGIYGWACGYTYSNGGEQTISTFVKHGFRHRGLGSVLKSEIIKHTNKSFLWQDSKTRKWDWIIV